MCLCTCVQQNSLYSSEVCSSSSRKVILEKQTFKLHLSHIRTSDPGFHFLHKQYFPQYEIIIITPSFSREITFSYEMLPPFKPKSISPWKLKKQFLQDISII